MLNIRKNIFRHLVLVSIPIVLWAFLMAVIPISCDYSPWRSNSSTLNNKLYLLVTNLGWIDSTPHEDNWDGNIIPTKVFQPQNAHLLLVETNGANISYTIQHNKRTGLFSRQSALVHIGLIRTNGVSLLYVDGVSDDVSERLQRIFAARTNGVVRLKHPSREESQ